MKTTAGSISAKNLLIAAVGGGAVMLMAAQLVAKPSQPAKSGGNSGARHGVTPRLGVEAPPLRLAGDPPIRELFRPLVSEPKPTKPSALTSAPTKPAPSLPPAAAPTPSAPGAPAAATPTTPSGPSVADVQMVGVVEIGGVVKALLKKTSSGESRYFAKGEDAFGFTVGEIKESEVELALGGQTQKVMMSTAVTIEGPGAASVAAASGFTGGDRGGRGDRGDRGGRGDRGSRGGSESGRSDDALSTSQIMSLPTWTERLKKLEELKGNLDPAKYDRLKKFMESRAQAEKK